MLGSSLSLPVQLTWPESKNMGVSQLQWLFHRTRRCLVKSTVNRKLGNWGH